VTTAAPSVDEEILGLVAWATTVSFDDIPHDVRQCAALVIADDLACAVGSGGEPEVKAIAAKLARSSPEATVMLARSIRTDRASAAMMNAIASNWCQLDEGHRNVMCHAGLYVVPAVTAEAEATGRSVQEVIRATVVAYEIVCRFAQTWRFRSPTIHPHAAWSCLGAAVAVATLRRLDAPQFMNALTASTTMAMAGPFEHGIRGALIQSTWAGVGVWAGFRCADFAECGIGGLSTSPSDVFGGLLGAHSDGSAMSVGLGCDWALRGGYHKLHSCAQQANAAVEATLQLVEKFPPAMTANDITEIIIEVHAMALTMNNRAPPTTLAARFSVPHAVAATCVLGHADAAAFSDSALHDNAIARLRNLIELKSFEPQMAWPHDRAARVRVVCHDGTTIVQECLSAEGGLDRPLSPEGIFHKCDALAGAVFPRFGRTMGNLYRMQPATLAGRWDDVVAALMASSR
jgi:2-methylcitrate dehydratase PrpD